MLIGGRKDPLPERRPDGGPDADMEHTSERDDGEPQERPEPYGQEGEDGVDGHGESCVLV